MGSTLLGMAQSHICFLALMYQICSSFLHRSYWRLLHCHHDNGVLLENDCCSSEGPKGKCEVDGYFIYLMLMFLICSCGTKPVGAIKDCWQVAYYFQAAGTKGPLGQLLGQI